MSQLKSEFLNIMQERGFYNQCTNLEGFDEYLLDCEKKGTPAVGYLGSDPTGDSLHVGHIVPLMMMRWFQKCGHKPITLVGGATARIGDPSGKDKLRHSHGYAFPSSCLQFSGSFRGRHVPSRQ